MITNTKKQRLKFLSSGWIFKNTMLKKRRRKRKREKKVAKIIKKRKIFFPSFVIRIFN